MAYLGKIYEECGQGTPDIDLRKADRMEFLNTLGMAYYDYDVEAEYLELITK